MADTSKPNIILSFDTTGSRDSIAVSIDGQVYSKWLPQGGSGLQSAILVPEMMQLLQKYGYGLCDVAVVCVLTGPGSFTGIRLGLATAQGLKLAVNCRIFAPTLLDLLLSLKEDSVAVVDSKRKDYFVKMDGVISIMDIHQVRQIAETKPIVSTDLIPGIEVILPSDSIASELISFYGRTQDREPFKNLEPFYIRTPEFVKKKLFITHALGA